MLNQDGEIDGIGANHHEFHELSDGSRVSRLEQFVEQHWVAAHNRQTRFLAGARSDLSNLIQCATEKATLHLRMGCLRELDFLLCFKI